jgi:hypothetical protein
MTQMKWNAQMKNYYLDELDNMNEIDKIDGIQPYSWTSLHEWYKWHGWNSTIWISDMNYIKKTLSCDQPC